MTKSIREIIRMAGGAKAVSHASKSTMKPVSTQAVMRWPMIGVHHDHWDLLIRMTGCGVNDLYYANRAIDRAAIRARRRSKSHQGVAA